MSFTRVTGMRAFWLIWLGELLSFTGSSITRFGLSVWVFQETRDPEAYSALLFFATIPLALGSLFAGPLIDRWDRRTVLIAANIISVLPVLVVAWLYLADQLMLTHLYVALFINGFASAFVLPAFDASIRMLVPEEQLGRASGLSQMIQSLGTILAPPIAGALVLRAGLGSIFLLNAFGFLIAILTLLVVVIPRPVSEEQRASSVMGDFLFGLRYIAQRPSFVFLISFLTLTIFAQSFVYALSGPIVLSFGTEDTLGLVYGAFGIGGLMGAILVGATGGTRRRMNGILIGALLMGISAVFASLRAEVLWIATSIFVFGAAVTYMIALNRTIYQEKAAPDILGRIFSFRLVAGVAAQALGILLAGWLAANLFEPQMGEGGSFADVFGACSTLVRGGALLVLLTGLSLITFTMLFASVPGLRRLEDRLPDSTARGTRQT